MESAGIRVREAAERSRLFAGPSAQLEGFERTTENRGVPDSSPGLAISSRVGPLRDPLTNASRVRPRAWWRRSWARRRLRRGPWTSRSCSCRGQQGDPPPKAPSLTPASATSVSKPPNGRARRRIWSWLAGPSLSSWKQARAPADSMWLGRAYGASQVVRSVAPPTGR
jgi:hypothetical protein